MTSECVIYPTCCEIAPYTLYRRRHIQCTHTDSHSRTYHTHVYIRCLTTLYIACESKRLFVYFCERAYVPLSLTTGWIFYHTQCTHMLVHLYEYAYVYASLTTGWIFYHKQCMHMSVHLHECAYVYFRLTSRWIFYHTQCTHMVVHLSEYAYVSASLKTGWIFYHK